jgi:DNA ligase-1
MLAKQFEERTLEKWHTDIVLAQPKLDGLRCRIEVSRKGVTLYSSECEPIHTVPHIATYFEELAKELDPDQEIEFDGELYNHSLNLHQIQSLVSSDVNRKDTSEVQFHCFDVISCEPTKTRTAIVRSLIPDSEFIYRVPTIAFQNNVSEIFQFLDDCILSGYEGIILRHPDAPYERKRSNWLMKYKPHQQDDYLICGYSIEVDKHGDVKANRLGRFICAGSEITDPEIIGEINPKAPLPPGYFGVGSGITDPDRYFYWSIREDLIFRRLVVKYQSITPKGRVPRHGVYKALVE